MSETAAPDSGCGGGTRAVTIVNQRGLHARASAKFVGAVAELPETISVTVAKDGHQASGSSILGLMMLGAARGDVVELHVRGDDPEAEAAANDALAALSALVENGFGED